LNVPPPPSPSSSSSSSSLRSSSTDAKSYLKPTKASSLKAPGTTTTRANNISF
jgi:hypothetical protein